MSAFLTDGKFGGNASNFDPTPEGEHNVAIVGLADMGRQQRTFKGRTEMVPMLVLLYSDGDFVHQDWQTFSLWKQSNLAKKIIRSTHGRDFDLSTIKNISTTMLGKLLRIEVEHKVTPDKTYANITNYMKANGKPSFPPDFEFPGGLHNWLSERAEGLVIHPKIKIGEFKKAKERDADGPSAHPADDGLPF